MTPLNRYRPPEEQLRRGMRSHWDYRMQVTQEEEEQDYAAERAPLPLTWWHVLLAAIVLALSAAVVLWVAWSLGPGG